MTDLGALLGNILSGPYAGLLTALLQLLGSAEGQKALNRLLGEAGVTQEMLEAALREIGPPPDPTVPRPIRKGEW
jgi:hypothetical protein